MGRDLFLRPDKADRRVWADTFTGRYHTPPSTMPKPNTVLDLGANIGLTCAHYNAMWPDATIVGVEMDTGCVEMARLNAPGCVFLQHAVCGRNGVGGYNPDVQSDAYSLVHDPVVRVETKTLAETIRLAFPPAVTVDFVKMDIEGAEWEVFAGPDDWVPLVRYLLVELHGSDDSQTLVRHGVSELQSLGFTAAHHRRHPQAVWAWR